MSDGHGHARLEGFDLHAGVVAPARHRHRLERLCRYALRPPIAEERLQMTADVIRRILRHLGLPTEVPEPAPARAPPRVYDPEDCGDGVVAGFDPAAVPTFEPAIDDWC